MPKGEKQTTAAPGEETPEIPSDVHAFLQRALRFSALIDGAPARCRRQECRRDGTCRVRLGENGDSLCRAGLDTYALRRAAEMAAFALHWLDEVDRENQTALELERRARGW